MSPLTSKNHFETPRLTCYSVVSTMLSGLLTCGLLQPFEITQWLRTNLTVSGTCVLQYSEDQTNGKLNVSIQPTTIASYFKQPSFTGPVALAYDTVVNDVDYVLYLVDKVGFLKMSGPWRDACPLCNGRTTVACIMNARGRLNNLQCSVTTVWPKRSSSQVPASDLRLKISSMLLLPE